VCDLGYFPPPETPVSVVDFDIELLLGIKDALEGETVAIDLLVKACHDSGPDSSLAAHEALTIVRDPESVFEGLLRSGGRQSRWPASV
jgi:hypothetical protein